MAVKRFGKKKKKRGRKVGWRKTTPKEDQEILAVFKRIRQPLGILVEASDVWKALSPRLRDKITIRTVSNRLRAKGYKMEEKLAGDDKGEDLKASINTTTKLFRNFSHAKSSPLPPSAIAARHY